jgi:5'-nucleotidase
VTTTTEALDGREATVRNRPGGLGALIAEGYFRMAEAAGAAPELAVFNGGSIRIDDVLPPGPVSEYDVIRVLPFGGSVLTVEIAGATLDSVLTQGVANRGSGGFLQTHNVEAAEGGGWLVGGRPLDPARTYRMTTSDFLLTGRETGLGYLNAETNPNVRLVGTHDDVRRAVITELRRRYGG